MKHLVACAAFACSIAHAGPPSDDAVSRLLDLTAAEASWAAIPDGIQRLTDERFREVLSRSAFGPDQIDKLQTARNRIAEVIREEYAWRRMKPSIAKMYAETFDEEEINALVDFYSTKAGRAYVGRMPVLRKKMADFARAQADALRPKIERAVDAALSDTKPPSGN